MATVRDITTMCKAGQVLEAYELAKADLEQSPTDVWTQREVGWALYYLIRRDAENGQYEQIIAHFDELQTLEQLNMANDRLIFENVVFWIGYFAKKFLPPTGIDTHARLSVLFSKVKDYAFTPCKGYSALLEGFIRSDAWQEMADFIDWWNLDNLTPDDYNPVEIARGRKIMSVAERAYIAYSKALLRLNDPGRIEEFLPQMDALMDAHPEMTYPGYFYGKLLLALGSTTEEALKVIVPFARKKASEFWVWQLLSDVFTNDQEKQLACLIRAVNCHTKEDFLGKVRIKLAALYVQRNQLDYARYQIDKVTENYLKHGWHLPYEVEYWIHQPWIKTVNPNGDAPIDHQTITDDILFMGTEKAIAIVTYVDRNTQKASIIYGKEKRMLQKFRIKVGLGTVLKIHYVIETDGRPNIINAAKTPFPTDLTYAQIVEGVIKKRDECNYAFLKCGDKKCFVSPATVSRYGVSDGQKVKCLIVYDYNKKRESWSWVCLSINNKNS